jgi:hypothetical protein
MNVAEQMGAVLQNTSLSVNIKERLDFSCAIFDASKQIDRLRAKTGRGRRIAAKPAPKASRAAS